MNKKCLTKLFLCAKGFPKDSSTRILCKIVVQSKRFFTHSSSMLLRPSVDNHVFY